MQNKTTETVREKLKLVQRRTLPETLEWQAEHEDGARGRQGNNLSTSEKQDWVLALTALLAFPPVAQGPGGRCARTAVTALGREGGRLQMRAAYLQGSHTPRVGGRVQAVTA